MVPGLRAEGVPPKGGGPGPAKPHSIFVQVTWLALPPGRQPSLPLDFIPDLPLGPGAPVPPHVVALTAGPPMRRDWGAQRADWVVSALSSGTQVSQDVLSSVTSLGPRVCRARMCSQLDKRSWCSLLEPPFPPQPPCSRGQGCGLGASSPRTRRTGRKDPITPVSTQALLLFLENWFCRTLSGVSLKKLQA